MLDDIVGVSGRHGDGIELGESMPARNARSLAVLAFVSTLLPCGVAQAAFTINLTFSGLTASQQQIFTAAQSTWQTLIVGYKSGVTLSGINISASASAIDGVNGVLGQAGPTNITSRGGTVYATAGSMQFDTADLAAMESNGSLYSVILHEMAHVIGFGTLWTNNALYVNNSGKYTGANALSVYKSEFSQPNATYIPVELEGASGTANGHWDETTNGATNVGITNAAGQDFRYELMTGYINTPAFISNTTIAQFADLGYLVSIPEPTLIWGLGFVSLTLARRQRR